ncbi:hypothetical protein LXT21_10790 [Myxococcus sp. K38C18041901]|uniref:hypothetical protein n=1 Tax=Myxococcus guangdongensis TaxID=2906760 RepID=UPI0020A7CE72|nr:hypothetical protein [Myxococcus guangdongensis]MCP3059260.1 hypothetical protein [Myxococcus guangdongensis]
MSHPRDLFDAVLAKPTQEVAAWLEGVTIGEPVDQEAFNWEVFAFTMATRAGEERSLPWARIALRTYEALAHRARARAAHSFWLSAMNLRARLIEDLGSRQGDTILDPEIVREWFQRVATLSPQDAQTLLASPDLQALPREKLLLLRDIKNALNILSRIAEPDLTRRHPELQDWLMLRARLP